MSFWRFLLWIWQLPQNLIAAFIIRFVYTDKDSYCFLKSHKRVYFYSTIVRSCFMENFTLGDYLFISADDWFYEIQLRKAYGYVLLSRILGPLWIPLVGLPRIFYAFFDPVGYYQAGPLMEILAQRLARKKIN